MSLWLRPLDTNRQRLLAFEIATTPAGTLTTETDTFGNTRHVLAINERHDALEVVSASTVSVSPGPARPERLVSGDWDLVRSCATDPSTWEFTNPSPATAPTPALDRFVAEIGAAPGNDPLGDLADLAAGLYEHLDYVPGATSVDSSIDDILSARQGVCQDYAHVMIAIARSWGVPTRYVSGYLDVDDACPDGTTGPPSTATHAWVECRLPEVGWVEFDPTNRTAPDQRYVRLAVGRDYRDVPPTRGVVRGGANSALEVDVRITRLPHPVSEPD